MKVLAGTLSTTARKALKGVMQVAQRGTGSLVASRWPRKRGKAKSPLQQQVVDQFVEMCAMIKDQDPAEQAYANDLTAGKLYMARDIQMAQMTGVLMKISLEGGGIIVGRRTLSASIQALLDDIDDTPGAMLVRGAGGWTSIDAAAVNLVLSAAGIGNVPYWRDISEILPTIQTMLDTITSDEGATIYRSGSAWVELPAGTDGQVMTYTTAGAGPIWATPAVAPTLAFDNRFHVTGTNVALASIASGHVIANSGTATAEAGDTSLTALLDVNIGTATGDLLVRGTTAWSAIAPDTSGKVLTSTGTTTVPTWQTPTSGAANTSAILQKGSAQVVTGGSNTQVVFSTAAHDDGGFYPGSGSNFIVPAGVTRVQLVAGIRLPVNNSLMIINFIINGFINGQPGATEWRYSAVAQASAVSGPIAVTAGDTIGVNCFLNTTGTITVDNSTTFGIIKLA